MLTRLGEAQSKKIGEPPHAQVSLQAHHPISTLIKNRMIEMRVASAALLFEQIKHSIFDLPR